MFVAGCTKILLTKQLAEKDKQLQTAKRAVARNKKQASKATGEASKAKDNLVAKHKDDTAQLHAAVFLMLENHGGLSRLTIFNKAWHAKNPDACQLLFGYRTWDEARTFVKCLFPDLNVKYDPAEFLFSDSDKPDLPPFKLFDKYMLTQMFLHCFANQQIIGMIASITRTFIGQFIAEWAPLWGNVGLDLGILNITAEYIARQAPELHIELDKFRIVYGRYTAGRYLTVRMSCCVVVTEVHHRP